MVKLAVIDFDNTIMNGETLEYMSILLDSDIKHIMNNSIKESMSNVSSDLYENITNNISYFKGLKYKDVEKICKNLPYTLNSAHTIKSLKQKGYIVICMSGGFEVAVKNTITDLDVDEIFCNYLHCKDGILTGNVGGCMLQYNSKGILLNKLQKLMNIKKEDTIAIGDGSNDISMFKYAGKSIAFCASDILKKNADIIINERDLSLILKHI